MVNNYFILKSESSFLKTVLKGLTVSDVYSPEKDIIIIEFSSDSGKRFLKISLEKNLETLFLVDNYSRPKKNVMSFLKTAYGASLKDIRIEDKDRIVFLEAGEYTLVLVLIPGKGNLLLVKNGEVVDAFRNRKDAAGRKFAELSFEKTDSHAQSELKKKFGYLGKHYYGEIISSSVLNRYAPGSSATTPEKEAESLLERIGNSNKFYLYKDSSYFLSHVPLRNGQYNEPEVFDSVNEIIRTAYTRIKTESRHTAVKQVVTESKEKKIKALEKQIANLKANLKHAEDALQYKESGDIIIQNIKEIRKGQKSYEFFDLIYGKNKVIKLNPNLSPSENANQYYAKFKGLKKSTDLLEEKIRKSETELENLKKKRDEVSAETDIRKAVRTMKNETKENEKLPFRIFRIHEKFSVWVGKDSVSNDLLTMKHSNQFDLWFHVRGASGSHTILKFDDKNVVPDKSLILKAASVAAYYSKARNARNVPVAYCERKYVRKKKGFKSGAVVMEKEKVVFVNPGLPES